MSKMNKFQAFRERNRKSNGYLLRKVSFNVAYKIVRFVLLFPSPLLVDTPITTLFPFLRFDFAAIVKQDFHQFHGRA